MHRTLQQCVLALVVLLSAALAQGADGAVRVIQLKHRTAAEILPVVQPLIDRRGAATGRGFQLFVRTSEGNFDEIKRIIASIDVPRRNLKITVRQSANHVDTNRMQRISGSTTIGKHTRVIVSGTSTVGTTGPDTSHGEAAGSLEYRVQQRTASRERGVTQFLRVLEGQRAFIRIGHSIPHVQPFLVFSHKHLGVLANVAYREVTTGFEVLPRLRGKQVEIEITPKLSFHAGHMIQPVTFYELRSAVLVDIGEWVDLGSVLGISNSVARAILDSGTTQASQGYTVMLKVE